MSDDPRMRAAAEVFLDVWFKQAEWRGASSHAVDRWLEETTKALQAALAVLERPDTPSFKQSPLFTMGVTDGPLPIGFAYKASINPPNSPYPAWSPEMAELLQLMAWRLANADMGWNTLNRANFWKKFKAAFPDPAREG